MHTQAASATAIAFVKKLEAAVLAEKAAREKRLAGARGRAERTEGWLVAARVKRRPEKVKTALALRALYLTSVAA